MKQLIIAIISAALTLTATAQTAAEKGLAISQEADRRDNGWVDSQAALVMILRNRQGDESVRHLRIRSMEVGGDGDKGLSIFDEPKDVQGTAVLTWSHSLQPDDQWIFLPALKRVKRISSKNKSGPFMGSEFAYEDIASQEVDKYQHNYLRDEPCNGLDCFVIERIPQYEYSGYTRQEVWIDKEHYRPQQIVFYDRKGSRLKTLTLRGYQQYPGQYWRAAEMFMENHQTGKTTLLQWHDYKFGNDLSERDFDNNALKRVR